MPIQFDPRYREKLDRKAISSIARVGPDQRFADHIQLAIPRLHRRGWVQIVKHSDGDYVVITDRGYLEWLRRPSESARVWGMVRAIAGACKRRAGGWLAMVQASRPE